MTFYRTFIFSTRPLGTGHECHVEGPRASARTIAPTPEEAEMKARALVDVWYADAAAEMWGGLVDAGLVTREG